MGEGRVIELVLYVDDVATAADFLAVCGLRLLERSPAYAVLASGHLRVALAPAKAWAAGHDGFRENAGAPGPPLGAEIVLAAEDVGAAHAAALIAGARSFLAPRTLTYGEVATVRSPGGLRVTWFHKTGVRGSAS